MVTLNVLTTADTKVTLDEMIRANTESINMSLTNYDSADSQGTLFLRVLYMMVKEILQDMNSNNRVS